MITKDNGLGVRTGCGLCAGARPNREVSRGYPPPFLAKLGQPSKIPYMSFDWIYGSLMVVAMVVFGTASEKSWYRQCMPVQGDDRRIAEIVAEVVRRG
jgi:hypothetical protein